MVREKLKKKAAEAALAYVHEGDIIGLGSGSTVNYFIEALAEARLSLEGVVAASHQTESLLKEKRIPILELNETGTLSLYIDGADEIDDHLNLIKGGGGALTREKIIASASHHFICIADHDKKVSVLGKNFPLPIEVIPMARSFVARELIKLGGRPVYRQQYVTDNGNHILDVHHLDLSPPLAWEAKLNNLPGIVTHGLFASRRPDTVLLASEERVDIIKPSQ